MGIASDIARIQGAKQDLKTAINAKGGSLTTELIDDYAAAVDSLSTSTPGTPVVEKDVNFYDYEGTLVYSYTIAEANALSALPALPDHSSDDVPLTGQEWNYTLAEVQAIDRPIDVGSVYITTDGKSHFIVKITPLTGGVPIFKIAKTVSGDTLNIDFGDGQAAQSNNSNATVTFTPTAMAAGTYDVTVWLSAGATGKYYNYHSFLLGTSTTDVQKSSLLRVHLGSNILALQNYAFSYCLALRSITIPTGVLVATSTGYMFSYCSSLYYIVLPRNMRIGVSMFEYCYSLDGFSAAYALENMGGSIYCNSLKRICYPYGITTIVANSINYAYSVLKVVLPPTVTSIASYAFRTYTQAKIYDFSSFTSVPTLATNNFDGISPICIMKIPTALFTTWAAATNWAAFANYMVAV